MIKTIITQRLQDHLARAKEHEDTVPHEECECKLCKALRRAEKAEADLLRVRGERNKYWAELAEAKKQGEEWEEACEELAELTSELRVEIAQKDLAIIGLREALERIAAAGPPYVSDIANEALGKGDVREALAGGKSEEETK